MLSEPVQDVRKIARILDDLDVELGIMHKQLLNSIGVFFPREDAPDLIKYTYHRVNIKGYIYGYKMGYENGVNKTTYLGPCNATEDSYKEYKALERRFKKLLKTKLRGQKTLTGILIRWKEYLKIGF